MTMEPAEHHEKKSPMELTVEALEPSKSKDEVTIRYDTEWSAMRTGHAERPIHCYDAINETKRHGYKVELIEAANGKPYGWCNCAASVICKHIKTALMAMLTQNPDFGGILEIRHFQDDHPGAPSDCPDCMPILAAQIALKENQPT